MADVDIGVRTITCSRCGSELLVQKADDKPAPDDRVVCPNHGDMGSYEDVSNEAFERFREKIGRDLRKAFGFKIN